MPARVVSACAAAALGLAAWAALDPAHGGIATLLAAVAIVAAGFAWLEGGTFGARDLTLVATLGGLAAAGRVLFAPVPSVQPVTRHLYGRPQRLRLRNARKKLATKPKLVDRPAHVDEPLSREA